MKLYTLASVQYGCGRLGGVTSSRPWGLVAYIQLKPFSCSHDYPHHDSRFNDVVFRLDMSGDKVELPRIGETLKGELLKEHSLKPTEANEKNILPTAEDVKQEKTHQSILSGVLTQPLFCCVIKIYSLIIN